jgi:hypothetical protein
MIGLNWVWGLEYYRSELGLGLRILMGRTGFGVKSVQGLNWVWSLEYERSELGLGFRIL